jgi:GNAT superfamily N-acetyltransferase
VAAAALVFVPHLERGTELEVNLLVTASQFRGKGYGTLLLNYAEELGRATECDRVILHSRADRTDAHAFYERVGFDRYGPTFVKQLRRSAD